MSRFFYVSIYLLGYILFIICHVQNIVSHILLFYIFFWRSFSFLFDYHLIFFKFRIIYIIRWIIGTVIHFKINWNTVGPFYNEHHYNEFFPITNKQRVAFRLSYSVKWKMLIITYLDITNSLYNELKGIYTCMFCHLIFTQL